VGLCSAFDLLLGATAPLRGLDDLVWQSLSAGSKSSKHPWNLGCLATVANVASVSSPSCRTVVLRRVDQRSRIVECHTDVRSKKVEQLGEYQKRSPVSWLFYESSTKIQLRLEGVAEVINGEEADEAWNSTSLQSRAAYLSIESPGTPGSGPLPPDTSDRRVTLLESERGRANFRIVRTRVERADWLYLKTEGHVRAKLDYSMGGEASAQWVVP
jgi:hypothetical protein